MENEVPKNHYVYHVAYHAVGYKGESGVGSTRIFSPEKAHTQAWVTNTQAWLLQETQMARIIVLSWQRLKGDERWDEKTNG